MNEANRISRELSSQERDRLESLREQISQELPDLIARDRLRRAAEQEPTISGVLRRAIHRGDQPLHMVARNVGVTPLALDEFLTGEAALPSDVMDKLAALFGYELKEAG